MIDSIVLNPWAATAIVWPFAWAVAVLIYRARPDGVENRRLLWVLLFGGTAAGLMGGVPLLTSDLQWATWAHRLGFGAALLTGLAWLRYVVTFDVPWLAALRGGAARSIPAMSAAVVFGLLLWRPEHFMTTSATDGWAITLGFAGELVLLAGLMPLVLLGLIASADMWRRRAGAARVRARSVTNVVISLYIVVLAWITWSAAGLDLFSMSAEHENLLFMVATAVVPIGALMLAMSRYHLYGLEVSMRGAAVKALSGLVFAALFVGLSEGLETFLDPSSLSMAIIMASAIGIGLQPVQGVAQAIVDRVMPAPAHLNKMDRRDRRNAYRALLTAAAADSVINITERHMLDAAQVHLRLSDDDISYLEEQLTLGAAPPESVVPVDGAEPA